MGELFEDPCKGRIPGIVGKSGYKGLERGVMNENIWGATQAVTSSEEPVYVESIRIPGPVPRYRLLHRNTARSGCSICKSSLIPVSILICSNSLALALPSSSPFMATGFTLKSRNSPTSTPTNSTCANLRPGQLRAPPDQPTKALLRRGGSFKCSTGCDDDAWESLVVAMCGSRAIHREGSNSSESAPQ